VPEGFEYVGTAALALVAFDCLDGVWAACGGRYARHLCRDGPRHPRDYLPRHAVGGPPPRDRRPERWKEEEHSKGDSDQGPHKARCAPRAAQRGPLHHRNVVHL